MKEKAMILSPQSLNFRCLDSHSDAIDFYLVTMLLSTSTNLLLVVRLF